MKKKHFFLAKWEDLDEQQRAAIGHTAFKKASEDLEHLNEKVSEFEKLSTTVPSHMVNTESPTLAAGGEYRYAGRQMNETEKALEDLERLKEVSGFEKLSTTVPSHKVNTEYPTLAARGLDQGRDKVQAQSSDGERRYAELQIKATEKALEDLELLKEKVSGFEKLSTTVPSHMVNTEYPTLAAGGEYRYAGHQISETEKSLEDLERLKEKVSGFEKLSTTVQSHMVNTESPALAARIKRRYAGLKIKATEKALERLNENVLEIEKLSTTVPPHIVNTEYPTLAAGGEHRSARHQINEMKKALEDLERLKEGVLGFKKLTMTVPSRMVNTASPVLAARIEHRYAELQIKATEKVLEDLERLNEKISEFEKLSTTIQSHMLNTESPTLAAGGLDQGKNKVQAQSNDGEHRYAGYQINETEKALEDFGRLKEVSGFEKLSTTVPSHMVNTKSPTPAARGLDQGRDKVQARIEEGERRYAQRQIHAMEPLEFDGDPDDTQPWLNSVESYFSRQGVVDKVSQVVFGVNHTKGRLNTNLCRIRVHYPHLKIFGSWDLFKQWIMANYGPRVVAARHMQGMKMPDHQSVRGFINAFERELAYLDYNDVAICDMFSYKLNSAIKAKLSFVYTERLPSNFEEWKAAALECEWHIDMNQVFIDFKKQQLTPNAKKSDQPYRGSKEENQNRENEKSESSLAHTAADQNPERNEKSESSLTHTAADQNPGQNKKSKSALTHTAAGYSRGQKRVHFDDKGDHRSSSTSRGLRENQERHKNSGSNESEYRRMKSSFVHTESDHNRTSKRMRFDDGRDDRSRSPYRENQESFRRNEGEGSRETRNWDTKTTYQRGIRIDISRKEYERRLEAKVCLNCCSRDHLFRTCRNQLVKEPMEGPENFIQR